MQCNSFHAEIESLVIIDLHNFELISEAIDVLDEEKVGHGSDEGIKADLLSWK